MADQDEPEQKVVARRGKDKGARKRAVSRPSGMDNFVANTLARVGTAKTHVPKDEMQELLQRLGGSCGCTNRCSDSLTETDMINFYRMDSWKQLGYKGKRSAMLEQVGIKHVVGGKEGKQLTYTMCGKNVCRTLFQKAWQVGNDGMMELRRILVEKGMCSY